MESHMLSFHPLINQTHRPPLLTTKKLCSDILKRRNKPRTVPSSSASSCCVVCSTETDSQQFQVDPDKAKQALQDLDQQLQSFSTKRVAPPKKKVEEMKLGRDEMRGREMAEISGSFLANSAVVLFIFSIFYNVLFYTVIKPSIDVPLPSSITDPPLLQQFPLSSLYISPSLLI